VANVAVDLPCKNIAFKDHKSLRDRLSLASAQITQASEAQLCGQLYAIRSATARSIYLPVDLSACEDGFLKTLVCTDLLSHEVWPGRIRTAPQAAHTFEAYTSPLAILRNQKRQMIGQTIVHILVDNYFKRLSEFDRRDLARTIQQKETTDPTWLKRLIAAHLREIRWFWKLYPGLLGHKLLSLRRVHGFRKAACSPSALLSLGLALVGSWLAYRSLKSGATDYWPKAQRRGLNSLRTHEHSPLGLA
jgi:hypothetical protein